MAAAEMSSHAVHMANPSPRVATPQRASVDLSVDGSVDTSVDGSVDADVDESPLRDGRSENSLAVLCQRFVALYRDHPEPINIDHAAKELGIQRRRMYEILNIIQSVGLVMRLRASFYRWQGQDHMTATLERLKSEGLARHASATGTSATSAASAAAARSAAAAEGQRKKAVATALGERFVQIFLCNEVPQPIVLEDIMELFTACIGGALTNQMSCARRLYDIANVFCAVGLIAKSCSSATDHRRKKRLYSWIGPVLPLLTPLRPQRAVAAAPSVSPGSSSAKRAKSETGSRVIQRRAKKIKSSLEESIVKADAEACETLAQVSATLKHPARLTLPPSASANSTSAATRANNPPLARAVNFGNAFFPSNAKDAPADHDQLTETPCPMDEIKAESVESSSDAEQVEDDDDDDLEPEEEQDRTPADLRATIARLTKALAEAHSREQELLRRIDSQDAQISKLLEAKHPSASAKSSKSSGYLASPLTSFLISPYPTKGMHGTTGVTPSPLPLSDFTTGLTGSGAGRRCFLDNTRLGPSLPSINDPGCASPKPGSSAFPKPPASRHSSTPQRKSSVALSSSVMSTPPSLIAAAASSLLSLTPSQAPDSPAVDLLLDASALHDKENVSMQRETAATTDDTDATHDPDDDDDDDDDDHSAAAAKADAAKLRASRRLSSLAASCAVLESPASLKTTFDGISPLPKSCVSDCFS